MGRTSRLIQLISGKPREVGVVHLSDRHWWSASYQSAAVEARSLRGCRLHAGALSDTCDEASLRAWAERAGSTLVNVVPRPALLTSYIRRFTTDKTALLIGSIEGTVFLGLIKEHVCVFDFSATTPSADIEKALRHCLRLHKGGIAVHIAADTPTAKNALSSLVAKTLGVKGTSSDAHPGVLLAAAAAPMTSPRPYALRHIALAAACATLFVSTLVFDYSFRQRLREAANDRDQLRVAHSQIMERARSLEHEVAVRSGDDESEATTSEEASRLLQHVAQTLPASSSISVLTFGTADQSPEAYGGVRASGRHATRHLIGIQGVTRDLEAFSGFLERFHRTPWHVSRIDNLTSLASDTTPSPAEYRFLLELRSEAAS